MNDCDKYLESISLYVDGLLPEEDCSALRAHIASCPVCAARLEGFRLLTKEMENMEIAPPPTLHGAIMNAIHQAAEEEPELPTVFDFWRRYSRYLKPMAAVVVLAVLLTSAFGNHNRLYLFGPPGNSYLSLLLDRGAKNESAAPADGEDAGFATITVSDSLSDSDGVVAESDETNGGLLYATGMEESAKAAEGTDASDPPATGDSISPDGSTDGTVVLENNVSFETESFDASVGGGASAGKQPDLLSGSSESAAESPAESSTLPPEKEKNSGSLSGANSASGTGNDSGENSVPEESGETPAPEEGSGENSSPEEMRGSLALPYDRAFAFVITADNAGGTLALPAFFDDFKQEDWPDSQLYCIFVHSTPELTDGAFSALTDAGFANVTRLTDENLIDDSQSTGLVVIQYQPR